MSLILRLLQLAVITVFYLFGTWLQAVLHLPLSGSIVGLLLLLAALSSGLLKLRWVESGAHTLLSVLPLFFIPATVAVMNYGHFFTGKGLLLIGGTIASTVCTLIAASLASVSASRRPRQRKEDSGCR